MATEGGKCESQDIKTFAAERKLNNFHVSENWPWLLGDVFACANITLERLKKVNEVILAPP